MQDKWYTNATIYALDVETYMDGNGDGIGDFQGLISRLDYLSGLGINCIWLRPFYPSPRADDGYDIMNYYDVDKRYGSLGDFVDFITKAKAIGIRVIIDIVANHTSNKHPWFQQARKDRKSPFRDYYIWSKKPRKDQKQQSMISDSGIWQYDRSAREYYLHHFLKEQPDLNLANPEVLEEIKKIMGFWLQLGVCGFRIDAAHIWLEPTRTKKKYQDQLLGILNEMRDHVKHRNSEAVLLAEANVPAGSLHKFFANGTRMDLLFNFIVNQRLFLSVAREEPAALMEAMTDLKDIKGEWVNFLRHHDELNLEMLNDEEKQTVFDAFAPGKNMQIFGHGIRRRLPPMLDNNRKKLEHLYALMFSLPGIPLINYGEEIAMGDDLDKKGRLSVRTVMQWENSRNAGFTRSRNAMPEHTPISRGKYSYSKVNVSAQQREPGSFLNWMERLISTRKQCPQLSYGKWDFIKNNKPQVLSFCCEYGEDIILVLHNFSAEKTTTKLKTDKNIKKLIELFSNREYESARTINDSFTIDGYGYRWFKSDNY